MSASLKAEWTCEWQQSHWWKSRWGEDACIHPAAVDGGSGCDRLSRGQCTAAVYGVDTLAHLNGATAADRSTPPLRSVRCHRHRHAAKRLCWQPPHDITSSAQRSTERQSSVSTTHTCLRLHCSLLALHAASFLTCHPRLAYVPRLATLPVIALARLCRSPSSLAMPCARQQCLCRARQQPATERMRQSINAYRVARFQQ